MTAGWTPPPVGRLACLRGASADTAALLVGCVLDELERIDLVWPPSVLTELGEVPTQLEQCLRSRRTDAYKE